MRVPQRSSKCSSHTQIQSFTHSKSKVNIWTTRKSAHYSGRSVLHRKNIPSILFIVRNNESMNRLTVLKPTPAYIKDDCAREYDCGNTKKEGKKTHGARDRENQNGHKEYLNLTQFTSGNHDFFSIHTSNVLFADISRVLVFCSCNYHFVFHNWWPVWSMDWWVWGNW